MWSLQSFSQPGRFAGLQEDDGDSDGVTAQQPSGKEEGKEAALADVTNES